MHEVNILRLYIYVYRECSRLCSLISFTSSGRQKWLKKQEVELTLWSHPLHLIPQIHLYGKNQYIIENIS